MKINRLKLYIQANKIGSQKIEDFGFDLEFKKGLNIIKGENTSGKSTIVSCIYYGLCLEELLGAKNSYSLDKALKKFFELNNVEYKISSSCIYIEIENKNGQIITLKRSIVGGEANIIKYVKGKISAISEGPDVKTLFVHKGNNHNGEFGFYKWFADFLGLSIPEVLNRDGKKVKLYMQTIFPALFVEQTKGWSDFLASIPYFGIKDNKLRVIEFLFNLNALKNEVEKENLKIERDKIEKRWQCICDRLDLLARSNLSKIVGLTNTPFLDKSDVDLISITVKNNLRQSDYKNIDELLEELNNSYDRIDDTPKLKKEAPLELKRKLGNLRDEFDEHNKSYKVFFNKFQGQKRQLSSYKKYLDDLDNEISINNDIRYLTEKDPSINELKTCPTCNQDIGNSLISTNLDIELKTIEGNLKYLKSRKKLLESSIESLETVLEEKSKINYYYQSEAEELKNEIKYLEKDLIAPEMMPSMEQIYQKIKVENKINTFKTIKRELADLKEELSTLSVEFATNKNQTDDLKIDENEDTRKLEDFEEAFKKILLEFEYKSNLPYYINIQKKLPFKYFPAVKIGNDLQKLQLCSSSSDFIRSIWAFTISLLIHCENHPGLLLIDEPCQHSMKKSSLAKLFKNLSTFNDKQVIVAVSTDKKVNTEDHIEYSVDEVLNGLSYHEYTIEDKAIVKM